MPTIEGTPGNDILQAIGAGDFQILAGAGEDKITIRRQAFQTGTIVVQAGDGYDTITVEAYGRQSVTVYGGNEKDIFYLIAGGRVYGGEDWDLFVIDANASPNDPFFIADFSKNDSIDLPILKSRTAWVDGTNPFTHMRFSQLGEDAVLQINLADGGWTTFGVFEHMQASDFKNLALWWPASWPPVIETLSFVSMATSSTIIEGGKVTVNFTLSSASAQAITIDLNMTSTGSGTNATGSNSVTIAPGQTQGQLSFNVYEDAVTGDGKLNLAMSLKGGAFVDPRVGSALSIAVTDNDAKGFSVALPDAVTLYKNLTQLAGVASGDLAALSSAWSGPAMSTRAAVRALEPFALSTTSVALTAYQFFTGKTPSKLGLAYLVSSPDNPSDLNDAGGIYTGMNLENRYINFAANLGLVGDSRAIFSVDYKALTFRQAVEKAYDIIIGKSLAAAAGINAQAAIDGVVAASGYFDALATQRMGGFDHDLAMKAGMIGYLMAEGQKAHVGNYARAVENFYLDLTDGAAQHYVDLVAVYGPGTMLDAI